MSIKVLTNHFGGPLNLHRAVFEHIIAQTEKRNCFDMVEDLFANPDEVWQLELPDPPYAWRYVKFYQQGALFGIVDIGRLDDLRIVDWYFLPHDANSPDAGAQAAAIDAQRSGQLNHTKRR
jgi:hypothetical protein